MNVDVRTPSGQTTGQVDLDDAIFGAKVNGPLMHQIVVAQLASARAGTHSTKTRGEVRGGGAKPWRQKGTGRARHGSTREPQWKGGGAGFGPKKMKAAALRSALSARAAEGKIVVVDGLSFDRPRTKDALRALQAWGVEGKALLVLTKDEVMAAYAFRNIPTVHVIAADQLNTYDVLDAATIVFTRTSLDAVQSTSGSEETS